MEIYEKNKVHNENYLYCFLIYPDKDNILYADCDFYSTSNSIEEMINRNNKYLDKEYSYFYEGINKGWIEKYKEIKNSSKLIKVIKL